MEEFLVHHGILGQKWGIRRYQNPDGTLTEAGRKHIQKMDMKWVRKNEGRVYKETYKKSRREFSDYVRNDLNRSTKARNSNGQISREYMNKYNSKLAEIMNKNVSDVESPSGRVIQYVAKRGDFGVYTALASRGYDMSSVKRGVWASGKIAYKNSSVDVNDRD